MRRAEGGWLIHASVTVPVSVRLCSYTLKRKAFFRNLGTILLLAVVGTVLNNLVFGYLLFGFAKAGWIPLDANNPLECLLFGAVVSATDPVATLVSATNQGRTCAWSAGCRLGSVVQHVNSTSVRLCFVPFCSFLVATGHPGQQGSRRRSAALLVGLRRVGAQRRHRSVWRTATFGAAAWRSATKKRSHSH